VPTKKKRGKVDQFSFLEGADPPKGPARLHSGAGRRGLLERKEVIATTCAATAHRGAGKGEGAHHLSGKEEGKRGGSIRRASFSVTNVLWGWHGGKAVSLLDSPKNIFSGGKGKGRPVPEVLTLHERKRQTSSFMGREEGGEEKVEPHPACDLPSAGKERHRRRRKGEGRGRSRIHPISPEGKKDDSEFSGGWRRKGENRHPAVP